MSSAPRNTIVVPLLLASAICIGCEHKQSPRSVVDRKSSAQSNEPEPNSKESEGAALSEAANDESLPPPDDVGLPHRLQLFHEHLGKRGVFLDFAFARVSSVDSLFLDQFGQAIQPIDSQLQGFAGDFSGGVLILDRTGSGRTNIEQAPVVHFTSEGGIDVLGESADDFLALIASRDQEALAFHYGEADAEMVNWIKESGIEPHDSSGQRMAELAPVTRIFRQHFWSAIREANQKLHPDVKTDHTLILGKQLGDVTLGMLRAELDKRWGEPEIPRWGRGEGRTTLFYAGAPFVICVDDLSERVAEIELYAGMHRAISEDGADLMFMPEEQVLSWLKAKDVEVEVDDDEIIAPAAKLRLGLGTSPSKRMPARKEKALKWVESVKLTTDF